MADSNTPSIRPERPEDHSAIYDVTKRAFATMPYAAGDEQDLINKLRDGGALELSLVAERDGVVIGHVAFSPAFTEDGSAGWYALGPVSVEPELQSRGTGAALIEAGLAQLGERGAAGCVLVGNPDYYVRFGFRPAPESCPEGEPAEYYMMLPLAAKKHDMVVGFHPLFHDQS